MKAIAMCSCPRLGYMDFMGHSLAAFARNNIEYRNLFGVFWGQVLHTGIKMAMDDGADYIITTDYDSLYNHEDVAQLLRLAEQNPHADAICTMQMGRFSGLLVSTDQGFILREDLKTKPLVPVSTGHFGLTLLRTSSLKDLPKPWFWSAPDTDGEWKKDAPGKLDEDIFFWNNFKEHGRQLYLAPRIVIGHIETLIKWPDENLEGIYETTSHFNQFGPPADVWK